MTTRDVVKREDFTPFKGKTLPLSAADHAALVHLFRVFWSQGPTESEFAAAVAGMALLPEFSYIMAVEPLGGRWQ